jgi:hypothetical protein
VQFCSLLFEAALVQPLRELDLIRASFRNEKADFRGIRSIRKRLVFPTYLCALNAGADADPREFATLIVRQLPILALAEKL